MWHAARDLVRGSELLSQIQDLRTDIRWSVKHSFARNTNTTLVWTLVLVPTLPQCLIVVWRICDCGADIPVFAVTPSVNTLLANTPFRCPTPPFCSPATRCLAPGFLCDMPSIVAIIERASAISYYTADVESLLSKLRAFRQVSHAMRPSAQSAKSSDVCAQDLEAARICCRSWLMGTTHSCRWTVSA